MPNLPPGFFPLEQICAFCHHYGFLPREPEEGRGWAYCFLKKGWFKFQLGEKDSEGITHKPAGERTACSKWIQKGTVNYGS
ncbi:MAG: hypothetical protein PHS17_13770 [Desulfobacterales bacterium]|nr:hypothetical protein [Desulfobacterales bacterium]